MPNQGKLNSGDGRKSLNSFFIAVGKLLAQQSEYQQEIDMNQALFFPKYLTFSFPMENNVVVRPYPREALHWFSKYIFTKDG